MFPYPDYPPAFHFQRFCRFFVSYLVSLTRLSSFIKNHRLNDEKSWHHEIWISYQKRRCQRTSCKVDDNCQAIRQVLIREQIPCHINSIPIVHSYRSRVIYLSYFSFNFFKNQLAVQWVKEKLMIRFLNKIHYNKKAIFFLQFIGNIKFFLCQCDST